jgi:hypothetical protein
MSTKESTEERTRRQPQGQYSRCPARRFFFACAIDFLRRCRAKSAWRGSLAHLTRHAQCSSAIAPTKERYSSQRANKSSHADFDYGRSGHEEGGDLLVFFLNLQKLSAIADLDIAGALVHKWSIEADRPGKAMSVVWLQATRHETGMPRCVIRLITAQPVCASALCASRLRARRRRPISVL